jgi:UDP-N-acetylglucosamine--N-acetylmuramyl-(pentapeptide) pyrophosphoryl-undecaprenol N-acetylglucosamine transferase
MGKTIVIGAGGTGGHLFPAQSVASEIMRKRPDVQILFMAKGLSTNPCFHKDHFASHDIPSGSFSKNPIELATSCFSLGYGTVKSIAKMKEIQPDLVLGFGSYHVAPVLFGALYLKIPIILHEANAIPGKVNRFFSRKALWTAVTFQEASKKLSGTSYPLALPLRKEFLNKPQKEEAYAYFGLKSGKKTILIFGGSQGAEFLNQKCVHASRWLMGKERVQILHFLGKNKSVQEDIERQYTSYGLHAVVKEFEPNMHLAWAVADLAICRSGASTIAEQLAFQVPALFVPYPHAADDHQTKNAEIVVHEMKGGIMIAENMLSEQFLAKKMHELLQDESIQMMKQYLAAYAAQPKEELSDAIIRHL